MLKFSRSAYSHDKEVMRISEAGTSTINRIIGDFRQKHVTAGVGQAEVYRLKEAEAVAFAADAAPILVDYPYIQDEVRATGLTAIEAAGMIIQAAETSRSLLRMTEKLRREYCEMVKVHAPEEHTRLAIELEEDLEMLV